MKIQKKPNQIAELSRDRLVNKELIIWSILASFLKLMDFNFAPIFSRILVNLLPLQI